MPPNLSIAVNDVLIDTQLYRIRRIIAFNRLETRPRTTDFTRSLRAEVRDPLWMLTRQWQFGEFNGEDAALAGHLPDRLPARDDRPGDLPGRGGIQPAAAGDAARDPGGARGGAAGGARDRGGGAVQRSAVCGPVGQAVPAPAAGGRAAGALSALSGAFPAAGAARGPGGRSRSAAPWAGGSRTAWRSGGRWRAGPTRPGWTAWMRRR